MFNYLGSPFGLCDAVDAFLSMILDHGCVEGREEVCNNDLKY